MSIAHRACALSRIARSAPQRRRRRSCRLPAASCGPADTLNAPVANRLSRRCLSSRLMNAANVGRYIPSDLFLGERNNGWDARNARHIVCRTRGNLCCRAAFSHPSARRRSGNRRGCRRLPADPDRICQAMSNALRSESNTPARTLSVDGSAVIAASNSHQNTHRDD